MLLNPSQTQRAISEAWQKGQLTYLRRPHQKRMRVAWLKSKPISRKFFGCCNRGFGKSTDLFIDGLEFAQQFTTDIYFIAPVEKKLDDYLEPIQKKILRKAPSDFLYTYSSSDNIFRFPNKFTYFGAWFQSPIV